MTSVIRVYTSEELALSGGTAGMVADSNSDLIHDTTEGIAGTVANTENGKPYFVYDRFYYRIEANEPVLEFHIDWGDGEDNSNEKGNRQVVKFDEPTMYCVVDHVYTSSKVYYPLIRVKSVDGFLSKWYTNYTNSDKTSIKPLLNLPPAIASHNTTGQQSFQRVSLNKNGNGNVPRFIPDGLPPVCVVKTDKKRIFGGIANHILTQNFESGTQYPLLYAYSESGNITGPDVKLTVKTDDNHIREYVIKGTNLVSNTFWTDKLSNRPSSGNYLQRNNAVSEMAKMAVPFDNFNNNPTNEVIELLRAEILNVDKLQDDERIHIKAFNSGSSLESKHMSPDVNRTICILSNGNPIVDVTDPIFSANVDLSESFSKDPNKSIVNFSIDDDTIGCYNYAANQIFSGTTNSAVGNTFVYPSTFKDLQVASADGFAPLRDPTDILKGTELSMFDRDSNPKLNVAYSHDMNGHKKDADGRYLDFYRLIRGQVTDNASALYSGDRDSGDSSIIRSFSTDLYTSNGNALHGGSLRIPTSIEHEGLLMFSNASDYTNGIANPNWVNVGGLNDTSDHIFNDGGIGGTDRKLQEGGTTTTNNNTQTNVPLNYLLVCQTTIFDKIFVRTNNPNRGRLDSTDINDIDITAWYSSSLDGTTAWKPLKIKDNTNGFSNSGSITFKRPVDWEKRQYHANLDTRGPVIMNDDGTDGSDGDTVDPKGLWDFDSFAILIGINVNSVTSLAAHVVSVWPYGDEHSQLIRVVDPHHISLNDIAIAQSISFKRTGKFQTITDRFGKSEIRKMGVNGGKITFGSIDLGDTNEQGNRKKIKQYQQNATPVFLDVTHKSGERTRFYGVITNMSEDHPTGKQNPKYAVEMQVSHLIELDSSGNLLSDKISIGGNLDEPRKFFVST